jgi:C4-dicarboxylate-specific signal transduction histidine kinase
MLSPVEFRREAVVKCKSYDNLYSYFPDEGVIMKHALSKTGCPGSAVSPHVRRIRWFTGIMVGIWTLIFSVSFTWYYLYRVVDIRGGIAVSIPMQSLLDFPRKEIIGVATAHGVLWFLGIAVLGLGARNLVRNVEDEIHQQTIMLEEEAAIRQAAQEELAVKKLQLEILNQSLENRFNETIAEMRQKDQMLIQQGRLAAMGEMIHNIAHQWRQPLNNIGLIIQNIQLSYATNSLTSEEMDSEVANVMGVIMHMSRTIDDFRNFFRSDKEMHDFVIRHAVEHALEFVGATLASCNVQVDLRIDEDITISGYQNEYAQVLLNILGNARDVLVERKIAEPCITIGVSGKNGRSVVTIHDNGGGIDEDVQPKIFDPYFTTKEQGKGTGIGLYMSKAIIEQNMGGSLTVRNVDGGAEFRIEV